MELFTEMEAKGYEKEEDKYTYLVEMPMRMMTRQRLITLTEKIAKTKESITTLQSKTEKQLWLDDLSEFEIAYTKFLKVRKD